jgi:hypothetical protein
MKNCIIIIIIIIIITFSRMRGVRDRGKIDVEIVTDVHVRAYEKTRCGVVQILH